MAKIAYEDGLYSFHQQRVQNLNPEDTAMRLEFCHSLHIKCQLLPLIVFTDEATFTRNGITNSVTRIAGLTRIHMVLWKQIFNVVSLSVCGEV
jgi:hypothetical protein